MENYKLIGFDLDGTVLSSEGEFTDAAERYMNQIKKLGYKVIIITGRGYFSASAFFKSRNIDIDLICNNGNLIRNSKTDKTIYVNPIRKEMALKIIGEIIHPNVYPLLHINGYKDNYEIATILKNTTESVRKYPNGFGERVLYLDNFNDLEYDILSMVFAGEKEELLPIAEKMEKKYGKFYNIHLLYVSSKNLYIMEILQKTGDKYNGLKKYLSLNNIEIEETIVVGDDTNDILMIENAKIGIAMKNAKDIVKKSADIVSEYTNDDNGALIEVLKIVGD